MVSTLLLTDVVVARVAPALLLPISCSVVSVARALVLLLGFFLVVSGPQGTLARPTPQGAPPALWIPLASSGLLVKLPRSLYVQKKLPKSFMYLDFVWYGFSEKPKTYKKRELTLGTELIG